MKDINNPLLKAYYTALSGVIPVPGGTGFVEVYEGEEPDDLESKYYIVLSDIGSNDASTKSSVNHQATVMVTINSWEQKYNPSKGLNTVAGAVLQIVKPTYSSTLQADGIQIVSTSLQNDLPVEYGTIGGKNFKSRKLIFSHLINYYI